MAKGEKLGLNRREFIVATSVAGAAVASGTVDVFAQAKELLKEGERAEAEAFLGIDVESVQPDKTVVLSRKTPEIFVHRVVVEKKRDSGKITVDFRFEGPEKQATPLLLSVGLRDDSGATYRTLRRRCEDPRFKPPVYFKSGPKTIDTQPRQNHVELDIALDDLSRLDSLRVEFRRILQ